MTDSNYCYKCGQNRSTHDDGECEAVTKSMEYAALMVPVIRDPQVEIAKRLNSMAALAIKACTPEEWTHVLETLEGVVDQVVLERFKAENIRRAQGNR